MIIGYNPEENKYGGENMAGRFVAEDGALKGLILPLDDGNEWVIGRDPDSCQLLVEDISTSRKHLLCRATPEGIVAENLSHTNPTQVNNKELKEPCLLKNNDTVQIGDILFHFYTQDNSSSEDKKLDETDNSEPINHEEKEEQDFSRFEPKPEQEEELPEELFNLESKTTPSSADNESLAEKNDDTIFEEEPENSRDFAEINFGFLDSGRWLLKVVGGPNNGAEFPMQPGSSYLIGTDPNVCDIVFQDASISRQHARITVTADDTLTLEDLNSRNGTTIDGVITKGKQALSPNALVVTGHTSFTVFDREGVMHTIVSPLMPKIVKSLVDEDKKPEEEAQTAESTPPEQPPANQSHTLGAFILIAILTGIFIIVGISTSTLFRTETVPVTVVADTDKILDAALAPFKGVKYTFNKNNGQLLLVGHVLSAFERNQLLSALQGLYFIKSIDDTGIVIDEYVWKEINQVIEQNPQWKGISITAPSAGHFVVTGYLRKRDQAYDLNDYLGANFPYPNLLENQVIVEDDVINSVENLIYSKGFKNVSVILTNGDVIISGSVPIGDTERIDALIPSLMEIRGVHSVHNMTVEQAPKENFVDVSSKYRVSGTSTHNKNLSAVINGRILMAGDQLDGMTIKEITTSSILLEKDGTHYRINFGK